MAANWSAKQNSRNLNSMVTFPVLPLNRTVSHWLFPVGSFASFPNRKTTSCQELSKQQCQCQTYRYLSVRSNQRDLNTMATVLIHSPTTNSHIIFIDESDACSQQLNPFCDNENRTNSLTINQSTCSSTTPHIDENVNLISYLKKQEWWPPAQFRRLNYLLHPDLA